MAELLFSIAVLIALLAVVMLLARLLIGPTVADRAVALDSMTIISISIIVYVAHITGRFIYMDVAIVYALISFLGIVVLARYLEGGL